MRLLLDVNALLALGIFHHVFHARVHAWRATVDGAEMLTCSITELGFLRVAAQAPHYGFTVMQAQDLLNRLKREDSIHLKFLADDVDSSLLPHWVRSPGQTTDGHLLQLANSRGASLATLDERIPGAYPIP